MPEKANVYVIEPDSTWRATLREELQSMGHRVAMSAATGNEALGKIKDIPRKRIQVVVIEGDLGRQDTIGSQSVVSAIHIKNPKVRIVEVGYLSSLLRSTDAKVWKGRIDELGDVVTSL